MTAGVVLATALAAVLLACALVVRRRRAPAAPPVARDPRDTPFSLAQVAREAREHGAVAGRAAGAGALVAHRPDHLAGRRWVAERLEEEAGARAAELVSVLRAVEEELVALEADVARRRAAAEALRTRVDGLEALRAQDAELPRVEQDVRLPGRLAEARRRLEEAERELDARTARADALRVRREQAPGETRAQVAHLRGAGPALAAEHDRAFAAARLAQLAPAAAAPAPAPAPVPEPLPLDEITGRAQREAAHAGRLAAYGEPLAETADELPSQTWILARFRELLAAARAQDAQGRRGLAEALAVQDERCHDADRAVEAARGALDALGAQQDGETEDVARERERAQRALRAEELHRHEARLAREVLQAREGRLDAELEARLEHLEDAQVAAQAEHRLVFERTRVRVEPPRWGGFAGPEHPGGFPPPTPTVH
jgi:hypothetical protein